MRITLRPWTSHPTYKWRVSYPEAGKRKAKGFKTRKAAKTWIDGREESIANHGTAMALTAEEASAVVDNREFLNEHGWNIRKALEFASVHVEAMISSADIKQAVHDYIVSKEREGIKERSLSDISSRLNAFATAFPGSTLDAVTGQDIAEYIHEMRAEAQTKRNHARVIGGLYRHAMIEKWCNRNPLDGFRPPKIEDKPIEHFTPAEARTLLNHVRPPLVPMLAIGLFSGLRDTEIQALDWSNVTLPDGDEPGFIDVIRSPKTGKSRFVPMVENLAEWLKPHKRDRGSVYPKTVCSRTVRIWLAEDCGAVEIHAWPKNGLRHSFATYRMALTKDVGKVSEEMGNSPQMVKKHYQAARVREKSAQEFWGITPRKK
jgi:integrase